MPVHSPTTSSVAFQKQQPLAFNVQLAPLVDREALNQTTALPSLSTLVCQLTQLRFLEESGTLATPSPVMANFRNTHLSICPQPQPTLAPPFQVNHASHQRHSPYAHSKSPVVSHSPNLTRTSSPSSSCDETFNKLAYSDSKKYACQWPECGREFKTSWHLQSHSRHHTNNRTFDCLECTMSFTRKHDLMRHSRTVHASKDAEPGFLCVNCGKGFGRVDSLKRHLTKICIGTNVVETPIV